MKVEIRILDSRLREWGLPSYQSAMAAGIDLFACIHDDLVLSPQEPAQLIPTGIAMHMADENMCAFVFPRSGLGHKKGLVLGNCVGVIDADYTAQCFVSAWNRNPAVPGAPNEIRIRPGERIAQLVFVPILRPLFSVVEEFTQPSIRSSGGFGSTG